jgi:hypothetical protein
MRLEGLGQLKNPVISSGFEPATFWLVTQFLNQLRYRVPPICLRGHENGRLLVTLHRVWFKGIFISMNTSDAFLNTWHLCTISSILTVMTIHASQKFKGGIRTTVNKDFLIERSFLRAFAAACYRFKHHRARDGGSVILTVSHVLYGLSVCERNTYIQQKLLDSSCTSQAAGDKNPRMRVSLKLPNIDASPMN